MSLSTAGAKPELTRPSSAKTDLTCLSDILSQEPDAIGVSSQMFHAQNSLFETSQAITSMASPSIIRTFACKGGRITTISTRSPSPAASFQSHPSFLSHQSPQQPTPLQLHLQSVSWQSSSKAAPQHASSPQMHQKPPSGQLESTCSAAPTPATTPRDRHTFNHHAQATRSTQAVLLQVQAQLKAHRVAPDPPSPAGDICDTDSTTANWQNDGDSEQTPTATATATATTPSTACPESPSQPPPAPTSPVCKPAPPVDLPVSFACRGREHVRTQSRSPPDQRIPAEIPTLTRRPCAASSGRRGPATTLEHIREAYAAQARRRPAPLSPPPQPHRATLRTPRGTRGCREESRSFMEPSTGLSSFSMRIHGPPGGGCGASSRLHRQAREHRVSELFARPMSYATSRSIALKPRERG